MDVYYDGTADVVNQMVNLRYDKCGEGADKTQRDGENIPKPPGSTAAVGGAYSEFARF